MDRAYSFLTIKAVEDEERVIRGIATTPRPDRMGDIVEPLGVKFKNPMPLLHQHRSDEPVGSVRFDKPTEDGIEFEARMPKISEPGPLKDRVDTAWGEVKAGLVRAVSIGFRALQDSIERLENGGLRFLKTEVLELSLVTIPANADATIQTIKSIDAELRAASGQDEQSGVDVSGSGGINVGEPSRPAPRAKTHKPVNLRPKEGRKMQTYVEQIAAFEAKRQAHIARMDEITEAAKKEGRSKDESEKEEFSTLRDEIKTIDDELVDLRDMERLNVASAKPVNGETTEKASASRAGVVHAAPKGDLPKGTMFTRYVMAMAAAKGNPNHALEIAKRWDPQTPQVSAYIKQIAFGQKADPGTTTEVTGSPPASWGGQLVHEDNLASEFVELLRPATVVGRIDGFRRVPFNVRIPVQTGGSTVDWVGEAAAKPVSELAFDTILLTFSKIAGIVVLTEELVRLSSPSAEATVRQDMVRQVAQFMDAQFLDPNVTETVARPASITNGVTPVTASGTDAEAFYFDLNLALAAFDSTELGTGNLWVVMPTSLARGISTLRNTLGQFEFTGMSAGGGTIMGFPVIVSNSAPSGTIVLVKSDEILLADDGGVTIDASNQATVDMDGGNTPTMSFWQKNLIGVRAERWIRWRKRRDEAVAMIGSAAYGPTEGSSD